MATHYRDQAIRQLGRILVVSFFIVALVVLFWAVSRKTSESSLDKNEYKKDTEAYDTDVVIPNLSQQIETKKQNPIKNIYSTKEDGRIWNSLSWENGNSRIIKSGKSDPYDSELFARGNGQISIGGDGIAKLSGSEPRIYLYDPLKNKKWGDVEVTIYAKRISETGKRSSQGIVIGARSEHQDATTKKPCLGTTYYGRLLYDGRAVFQKELIHEGAYSSNMPSETNKAVWDTPDEMMPRNVWIGVKFIVKNSSDKKAVKLELYRDMTDGNNGGTWEKVAEYLDQGTWSQNNSQSNIKKKCGYSSNVVLLKPGTSVFVRNDDIKEMQYKKFSVREIE